MRSVDERLEKLEQLGRNLIRIRWKLNRATDANTPLGRYVEKRGKRRTRGLIANVPNPLELRKVYQHLSSVFFSATSRSQRIIRHARPSYFASTLFESRRKIARNNTRVEQCRRPATSSPYSPRCKLPRNLAVQSFELPATLFVRTKSLKILERFVRWS